VRESPRPLAFRYAAPAAPGFAAALALGVSDVLVKIIQASGCGVLTMLSFRSAVGLAFVATWLCVGSRARTDARVRAISLGLGLLFAVLIFCLFKAIAAIDVSTAVLTYFVYPLLTGLVASATGLEHLRWQGAVCAVVAFIGLAVMIGAHPAGLAFAGVAYALAAASCRTAVLIITRAYLVGADARLTTWYSSMSTAAVFVVLSFATGTWTPPQTNGGWTALVAMTLATTAGVLLVFMSTVRIGPFRTALIMNLEPLTAMVLSALMLGEVITPTQALGSGVMLASLAAFQMWR
jgi:probable blue pigment (indigoidine) exporter